MELELTATNSAPDAAMQCGFDFPVSLTEEYRPRTLDQFIGLEKNRKIMANLVRQPKSCAFRFVGPSGTGKTTMALALAAMLPAELHHIASKDCTLETVNRVIGRCHTMPHDAWDIMKPCKMHLVLVDEADTMTKAAQDAFLSLLDATEFPPNTIFVFTMNSTDRLEDRFLSRTLPLEFSSYGIATEASDLLARIWREKTAPESKPPNFARMVKDSCNNVRDALMRLEVEIMAA
jgi:replication-associated recombination protein RarA